MVFFLQKTCISIVLSKTCWYHLVSIWILCFDVSQAYVFYVFLLPPGVSFPVSSHQEVDVMKHLNSGFIECTRKIGPPGSLPTFLLFASGSSSPMAKCHFRFLGRKTARQKDARLGAGAAGWVRKAVRQQLFVLRKAMKRSVLSRYVSFKTSLVERHL